MSKVHDICRFSQLIVDFFINAQSDVNIGFLKLKNPNGIVAICPIGLMLGSFKRA